MAATFQDNFWGEEQRGFDVLLKRLKYGRKCSEALIAFISTRIEAEEEYIKRLQRLSTFSFPRPESFFGERSSDQQPDNDTSPWEVLGAMLTLPLSAAELATRHTILIESLKQQILWPLDQNLKEQNTVKRAHKQEMIRIVKAREGQQEAVLKAKERLFNKCKERCLLMDANVAGLRGKDLEKHEQKLRKAKEAEQEADVEYRSAIYRLSELHEQWISRMASSTLEFQKIDETRLELTKRILIELSVISECHMQDQAVVYGRLKDRASLCDRYEEVANFIAKYGTGNIIPAGPAYSAVDSVEETLRKLQMRSVNSPRKLYSSSNNSSSASWSEDSVTEIMSLRGAPSIRSQSSLRTLPVDDCRRSIKSFAENSRRGSLLSLQHSSSGSSICRQSFIAPSIKAPSVVSTRSSGLSAPLFRAQTLYSYQAEDGDELSFRPDQYVSVISTSEDPWWYGQLDGSGKRGFFPSNYVERL